MSLPISTLKQFPLLQVFSDRDLTRIQQVIIEIDLAKDEILFLEGASTNALFFILHGWLKAEKVSREGRQQTLRLMGSGEVVNELSVFSNEDNAVSVIAMEPSKVFYIPQSEVEFYLANSPLFSRAVVKNLAHRIQHLLDHVENLSLYPVEVRLARFLLDNAEKGLVIRQSWKTQSEIANQLGTVLDVINRYIQKFVRQGLIEIERDQIRIIDQSGLENIAAG